jgi:hypothetical protein
LWEAEVCDGVPITSQGWVPTAHCVGANAQTVATAQGTLKIDTSNPSFQFDTWHGEDPLDSYFNCLAPSDDPNGTQTVVGDQPIDPGEASWGSSTVGAAGGGTAPCQLVLSDNTSAYSAADVAVPLTNLDGTVLGNPAPESPLAVALPVSAAVVLAAGGVFVLRRRRSHAAA